MLALGIRSDEPNRIGKDAKNYYPLAAEKPMAKGDILLWWRSQDFDLEVPEHLGNCTWCWKKSTKKHLTLIEDYPEIFKFPKMLEEKYSTTSNFERKDHRIMFRNYMTTDHLFELAKDGFVRFQENHRLQPTFDFEYSENRAYEEYLEMEECAEECGSVWND